MTKSTDHFMPFYVTDYLRDTTHLTAEMHGAYMLLLFTCWTRGGSLPSDDHQLAAIARVEPKRWRVLKPILMAFFQEAADGTWTHKRVGKELDRARHIIDVRRESGRRGGISTQEQRRQANGEANGKANVEQVPKQTPKQTGTPSHSHLQESVSTSSSTSEIQSKDLKIPRVVRGALRARKGTGFDFSNPENRQAYARQKIGPVIGQDVMMAASDTAHPEHAKSVQLAQAEARRQGLMWQPPKAGTG